MKLLLVAIATDAPLRRDHIHLHLKGFREQPLAAAEFIPVPDGQDAAPILDAAGRVVEGLELELHRRRLGD